MYYKQHLLAFLFFIGLCVGQAAAQAHFGLTIQGGVPTNEYRENTNSIGVGVGLNAYFAFRPNVPFHLGFDFGYMDLGSNTINKTANVLGTPLNFRVITRNNNLAGHLAARIRIPLPGIQPYAEGLVGLRNIYTRTKIENQSFNNTGQAQQTNNQQVNASTQLSSTVFSYGLGGGIHYNLNEILKLDVRVIYLLGGEARYYTRDQLLKIDPNNIDLNNRSQTLQDIIKENPKKSRTDIFYANVGLAIFLGR